MDSVEDGASAADESAAGETSGAAAASRDPQRCGCAGTANAAADHDETAAAASKKKKGARKTAHRQDGEQHSVGTGLRSRAARALAHAAT